jgi:hypothetical protein
LVGKQPEGGGDKYDYFFRVLLFLAEHKISTAKLINSYCFSDACTSLIWRVLKELRNEKLIETKNLKQKGKRSYFGFSLTKSGLQEVMEIGSVDCKDLQIKSNTPLHDITLSEIRQVFSKISNCRLFITENLIRIKTLERDYQDLATFRSLRSDAAALIQISESQKWFAVEYERSQKSETRYAEKIKKWYQSDDLFSVLLIGENDSLIRQLIKIDANTLPHKPRKILYLSLAKMRTAKTEVTFINSNNNALNFKLDEKVRLQFPVLEQNFANP